MAATITNLLRVAMSVGLVAIVGACGDQRGASRVVARDSAGVRIVENPSCPAEGYSLWITPEDPSVAIGTSEGAPEQQLYRVANAVRLANGTIVVANTGSHELRFFDRSGQLVRSVGGEGSGPGEFRYLASVSLESADSVLAHDAMLRRMTVYDSAGSLARTFTIPAIGPFVAPPPVGRLADGTTVAFSERWLAEPPGLVESMAMLLRQSFDPPKVDTIAELLGGQTFWKLEGTFMQQVPVPFAPKAMVAVSDNLIYAANGLRPEVVAYTSDGTVAMIIRQAATARAVTPEDLEAANADYLDLASSPEARQAFARRLEGVPVPAVKPVFVALLVDREGHLWIRHPDGARGSRDTWSIFQPDGSLKACAAVPNKLRVTHIDTTGVVGVWRDELGVEQVRLYPLSSH